MNIQQVAIPSLQKTSNTLQINEIYLAFLVLLANVDFLRVVFSDFMCQPFLVIFFCIICKV